MPSFFPTAGSDAIEPGESRAAFDDMSCEFCIERRAVLGAEVRGESVGVGILFVDEEHSGIVRTAVGDEPHVPRLSPHLLREAGHEAFDLVLVAGPSGELGVEGRGLTQPWQPRS